MEDMMSRPTGRKSSHSGGDGGHCVEIARLSGAIGIRDAKDPNGPKLIMSGATFAMLAARLKR